MHTFEDFVVQILLLRKKKNIHTFEDKNDADKRFTTC